MLIKNLIVFQLKGLSCYKYLKQWKYYKYIY